MRVAEVDRLSVAACSHFGLPADALRTWHTDSDAARRDLHRAAIAFLTVARERGAADADIAAALGWTRAALVTRRAALHDLRFSAAVLQALASWDDGRSRPAPARRPGHVCGECGAAVGDASAAPKRRA